MATPMKTTKEGSW